jgi:hypothetical protein
MSLPRKFNSLRKWITIGVYDSSINAIWLVLWFPLFITFQNGEKILAKLGCVYVVCLKHFSSSKYQYLKGVIESVKKLNHKVNELIKVSLIVQTILLNQYCVTLFLFLSKGLKNWPSWDHCLNQFSVMCSSKFPCLNAVNEFIEKIQIIKKMNYYRFLL